MAMAEQLMQSRYRRRQRRNTIASVLALTATAIGLAAAIPASIGYNRIGAALARAGQALSHVIEEEAVGLARPARPQPATAEAR